MHIQFTSDMGFVDALRLPVWSHRKTSETQIITFLQRIKLKVIKLTYRFLGKCGYVNTSHL